jgi:FkbM family methyltransferase
MTIVGEFKQELRSSPGLLSALGVIRRLLWKVGLVPAIADPVPGASLISGGQVAVRLQGFGGEFELDARSHLFSRVLRTGAFEPEALAALEPFLKEGMHAVDVGANAGFYSVLFATRGGPESRVVAVEPSGAARARLERNLGRNSVSERVVIVHGALGRERGELCLVVPTGREEYSSQFVVHPSAVDTESSSETVPVWTLDEVIEGSGLKPNVIKVDVEGAEYEVLLGSKDTLLKFRPVLLLELVPELLASRNASLEVVVKYLEELRYELRWISSIEVIGLPRG